MPELDTHDLVIPFGKHKGERLTRLPVSYLKWLMNVSWNVGDYNERWGRLAKAEFERRGNTAPQIELSGHAIDKASLRVRAIWHETALNAEEGLYSWLQRIALEALEKGERLEGGKIKYQGMKFVIEQGEEYPFLKTIMQ